MDISKIRQAQKSDSLAVSRFLSMASFVHKHLDWKDVLEWVEKEPFLIQSIGNQITSILSCAADPPGVNWIHCYANMHSNGLQENFYRFLDELRHNSRYSVSSLFSVGLQDWYCKLLEKMGFTLKQKIVVLVWNGQLPAMIRYMPKIFFRPMEPSDLKQVHTLDNLAFEPIWSFSESALQQAYMQSERASVAEDGEKIIGYELTTSNHFSAHLARLAVHPEYQGRGIGANLVKEMLVFFTNIGKHQITVNTQDDNNSSLSLYKKMNFQFNGESFPVFTLLL